MSQEPKIKYIERIRVSNFWGIYDIDWTLDKDVNILIGQNGSGKTTFLRLLDQYFKFIHVNSSRSSFRKFNTNTDAEAAKKMFNNFFYLLECNGQLSLNFNNQIHHKKELVQYLDLFQEQFIYTWVDKDNQPIQNQKVPFRFLKTFDALLIDRDPFEKKKKPYIETPLDYEIDELIDDFVEYQLNLFKEIRTQGNQNKDIFKRYNLFIDILNELFAHSNKQVNKDSNRIEFILNDKETIKPYQLSSGEKQILIILLTVLLQNGQHHILTLDEPEISLHLSWQQKLIELLKQLNPNCQLIIATHSPSIFGRKSSYPIYRMEDILQPKELAKN